MLEPRLGAITVLSGIQETVDVNSPDNSHVETAGPSQHGDCDLLNEGLVLVEIREEGVHTYLLKTWRGPIIMLYSLVDLASHITSI
jgi:hypothetical protein